MPQLTNHSTPAERKRGCVWAVSGGVPAGTAFPIPPHTVDSDPMSWVIEFTPDVCHYMKMEIYACLTRPGDIPLADLQARQCRR